MGKVVDEMSSSDRTKSGYWIAVVTLLVLGFITGFTIGPVFWFMALAMIVLGPFRSKPRIFRSGVASFIGFIIGYAVMVPFSCTQTAASDVVSGVESVSPVVCESIVGIEYSGDDPFDPTVLPALISGVALAVLGGAVTWIANERGEAANRERADSEAR